MARRCLLSPRPAPLLHSRPLTHRGNAIVTKHRRARPPLPTTTAVETALLAELAPRLDRLADDVWVLAQRAPGLVADPALLGEAGRLLGAVRRLLCREPGHRLLPRSFPPGIGLAALALSLRQLQTAAARCLARREPGPSAGETIEATNRLIALVLSDMAGTLARRRGVALPGEGRDKAAATRKSSASRSPRP